MKSISLQLIIICCMLLQGCGKSEETGRIKKQLDSIIRLNNQTSAQLEAASSEVSAEGAITQYSKSISGLNNNLAQLEQQYGISWQGDSNFIAEEKELGKSVMRFSKAVRGLMIKFPRSEKIGIALKRMSEESKKRNMEEVN